MALGEASYHSYCWNEPLFVGVLAMSMKIGHPNGLPLNEEQQHLLLLFKQRLETMVSSGGLTAGNVQELVYELRSHPLISAEIMQELRQELSLLMPGQGFTFD